MTAIRFSFPAAPGAIRTLNPGSHPGRSLCWQPICFKFRGRFIPMSKNNNVNPNHYKVAGRERPGEDIVPRRHKRRLTQNREAVQGKGKGGKKR